MNMNRIKTKVIFIIVLFVFASLPLFISESVKADAPVLVQSGPTWNRYRFSPTEYQMEFSSCPINYYDDEWKPINTTFEMLDPGHIAYGYGYRAGNEKGLFNCYFKPNAQDDWCVAFAYNKSGDPTTHVLRSKLMGVGYLDPSQGNEYVILQNVLDSQGSIEDSTITYPGLFTGAVANWTYQNNKLKEEITLSEDAKTMLQNNPPSSFGLSNQNSYFVLVTRLDYQNLNIYNGSMPEQGNFTTDSKIVFKDILDEIMFALPIGDIEDSTGNLSRLTYRIIQYNNNYYLLSGLKVTTLNAMAFPVVIDPTLDLQDSTDDDYIYKSNANYNTAHDASSGTLGGGGNDFRAGQEYYDLGFYYNVYRAAIYFDTSALSIAYVIDSACLALYRDSSDDDDTIFFVVIQEGTTTAYPHKPPDVADYNKVRYTGDGGSRISSEWPTESRHNITLNASGLDMIQKGSWTKLMLRSSRDLSGAETPTDSEFLDFYSAEKGAGYLPRLYINYTLVEGVLTDDATNVEETTATMNGLYYGIETATCGFWIGNVSTWKNSSNWEQNVTCDGTYEWNEPFTKIVAGLTSGEYYYVRAWASNATGFYNDTSETYFLTKPNKPTGLTVTGNNATNISLSWTNTTVGEGTTQQTVIVYDKEDYPVSVSDGTTGYNGTAEIATIEGLDRASVYYFSGFTYVSGSGSPTLWRYSDLYDYESGSTVGGNYTIHVRWECNDTYVDLSNASMTHIFQAENAAGVIINESNPTAADGRFYALTDEAIVAVHFSYNSTFLRSVLVDSGDYNITVYVPCGDLGYEIGDVTAVVISFNDLSGYLTPENNAYGFIYRFNGSTMEYIHSDYMQADLALRAYLIIGNTYHIGVGCDQFVIENLGPLTIFENEYEIDVMGVENASSVWFGIFNITHGYSGNTLYVDFFDTTRSGGYGVQNATVTLYYLSNNTIVETSDMDIPWDFNYTRADTNTTFGYKVGLEVEYVTATEDWNETIWLFWQPIESKILTSISWMDIALNFILGLSPVHVDAVTVAYTSLAVAFISMLLFFAFSPRLAGLSVTSVGVMLAFFKEPLGLITDDVMNGLAVSTIIILGILMFIVLKKSD